jgi:alkanesulfonate monooxygenase SsuD/methylene tetrahydromethanopterin reductase-like flavin-dependent oxidoreductase (luciferase family)
VRHAIFVPPFDDLADPDHLIDLAVEAERAGWDGFFLWDHLLYSEPVREILDPYVCLGAIAHATSSMKLGTMVTPLIRRRPQVVARQAVTLDHLSHGRLVLGVGIGDNGGPGGELSAFGENLDARDRGRQLDEGLGVLTGLLSGERVHHQGEFYRAMDVSFSPTAFNHESIPIWIATRWPHRKPIRRAAHYQGIVVIELTAPSDVVALRDQLLERFDVVVLGRDGDDPQDWADAGATWLMTRLGPYRLDLEEARAVVAAGPRR